MPNEPANYNAPAIGEVFSNVVGEVRKAYESEIQRAVKAGSSSLLMNSVDVELYFKNVTLNQKGWVLFGKDTKESTMEVKLATRITPPGLLVK